MSILHKYNVWFQTLSSLNIYKQLYIKGNSFNPWISPLNPGSPAAVHSNLLGGGVVPCLLRLQFVLK